MNIATRPHGVDAVAKTPERGAFTIGSTMRHVLVMTTTGSVGLIAVFFVDFLTLLYIARLGDTNLTAAVGYASQMIFLLLSVNIGLSIAIGALVSRALGAGDRPRARRLAASGIVQIAIVSGVLALAAMPFTHAILALFGARDEVLAVGSIYLRLTLPATVFLGIGMGFSSVLRGVGDAKRAMYVTLGGAIVTACLDPIFIFGLHLGIYGAAFVLVLSRFIVMGVGWHGAVRVHHLVERPRLKAIWQDTRPMFAIAGPAVITNIATPVANIYAMHVFSSFGAGVIAAFAIMDRVTPVAFGVLFALSGSVGPIMGQNFGARLFDRVRKILTDCFLVAALYVIAITLVLWFAAAARRRDLRRQGRDGGPAGVLLPHQRHPLALPRRNLRRQRRLQQPRLASSVGRVQLGTRDARHDSLRDARRPPLWPEGRLHRDDPRRGVLWRHRGRRIVRRRRSSREARDTPRLTGARHYRRASPEALTRGKLRRVSAPTM